MARQNALVNRLSAVEILGETTVLFTVKTGTPTENERMLPRLVIEPGEVSVQDELLMEGSSVDPKEDGPLRDALEVGMLCNNASYEERGNGGEKKAVGEPEEVAPLSAALEAGLNRSRLLDDFSREREEPAWGYSTMNVTLSSPVFPLAGS